jgi:iron complex outermembrane receptor protein
VYGTFNEAIEGSKNLPFIPAPKLLTELRGDFKKLGKNISNVYVKFEIDNNFKQIKAFTTYNTETATAGYTLLNLGIGADINSHKGNKIFAINIAANNIGDVAYQSHLSRLKYAEINQATGRQGVFNMGRNFSVKVNVPLIFIIKKN